MKKLRRDNDTTRQLVWLWRRCQRKVPLPEFIEQRAKGTMELRKGNVWERVRVTWEEYLKDQDAALNATMNDLYKQMEKEMASIMFGDDKK